MHAKIITFLNKHSGRLFEFIQYMIDIFILMDLKFIQNHFGSSQPPVSLKITTET